MSGEPVIETFELTRRLGELTAVDAVSLAVREAEMVLTMPIFFASNAIYPIALMPRWLGSVAAANPLTYEVDGLRAVMLAGGRSSYGLGHDFAALALLAVLLIAIATRMYPRMTE